jgi:hypothetical protein
MYNKPCLLVCSAGLLFVLPFTETLIPNFWLYLIGVCTLCLGGWHSTKKYQDISLVLYIIALLTLWHLIIVIYTESSHKKALINEIVIASALILAALLAAASGKSGNVLKVFLSGLSFIGVTSASLGLLKQALLDQGIMVNTLVTNNTYPQGTSLSLDYNDMANLWLVALICIFPIQPKKAPVWKFAVSAILAAAILGCGSRRGLIALMLLPLAACCFYIIRGLSLKCLKFILRATSSIAIGGFFVFIITDSAQFQTFKRSVNTIDHERSDQHVVTPPRAYPWVISSTINQSIADSRLELVNQALPIVRQSLLLGSGFSYHELYETSSRQYPHLRFFTELLIGGVAYGLSVLCLFFYTLWHVLKNFGHASNVAHLKLSAIFLVVSVFWISSGDTWLSLPQWLSVALLINMSSCGLPHGVLNNLAKGIESSAGVPKQ